MKNMFSFKGGVHPKDNKEMTRDKKIVKAKVPDVLKIPLVQHIGAPAKPLVKKGDKVKLGQKIGEASTYVSSNIHSSVSGKVIGVKKCKQITGTVATVIIENDRLDERDPNIQKIKQSEKFTPKEIIEAVKEAGIVGLGGATFPTHVKLNPPKEDNIDTLIVNGAECEPYLTSDYRVMVETPKKVIDGIEFVIKALGVNKAIIGIEDNKPEAIKAISNECDNMSKIKVATLKTKYPQGGEKQMIKALTGREVPTGSLPSKAGCVVLNIGTVSAVAKAVTNKWPLIERVVTVTGEGVKNQKNLLVRVGTPVIEVLNQCGGLTDNCTKLISGGPMMGITQYTDDISVIKGTSGLLALTDRKKKKEYPCVKCARCVDACPMGLMPLNIMENVKNGNIDKAKEENLTDCIECGCCTFICPAKRPILQYIRTGKSKVGN